MAPVFGADDQVQQMMAAADDREADVIRELAIRVGLRWPCPCGWVNLGSAQRCDGCGQERYKVHSS